jgi:transcription elongation factor GreA
MEKNHLTPAGYSKVSKLLQDQIKVKRAECIELISEAQKSGGELSENTEYLLALEERDKVENKITELSRILDNCVTIDINKFPEDGKVRFGSTVRLLDIDIEKEFQYKIIGEIEASLKEGSISYKSPLGKAVLGLNLEDEFDLVAPNGIRTFEILEIKHI